MNQHFKLTTTVMVADFLRMLDHHLVPALSAFIDQRFTERYVTSLQDDAKKKNGFCIMAVSCLMIESLESFWQGWPNTKGKGKSEHAFCSFFDRNANFAPFRGHAADFYKNVRCGILHQAETCRGWRIHRRGPLFDAVTKTINATAFHRQLRVSLASYRQALESSPWDSDIWVNFQKKMKAVCDNCG
jgi:hypothetical protein